MSTPPQLTVYSGLARPSASSLRGSPASGVEGGPGPGGPGVDDQQPGQRVQSAGRRRGGQPGQHRWRRRGGQRARPMRSRACSDEVVSQAAPAGQPPTLGGRSGTWPSAFSPAEQLFALLLGQRGRVDAELAQRADQPLHRLLHQLPRVCGEGRRGEQRPQHRGRSSGRRPGRRWRRRDRVAEREPEPEPAGQERRRRPAGRPAGRRNRRRRSRPVCPRIVFCRRRAAGRRAWPCRCAGRPSSRSAPGRPALTSSSV